MNAPPARSPRYKYTGELTRIALEDGMTQEEVARLCRVSQSVVSDWSNNKKKARAEVLKPLIERYGYRLNKTAARVYLVQGEPQPPFEATQPGQLLRRLTEDPESYARERMTPDELDQFVASGLGERVYVSAGWKNASVIVDALEQFGGRLDFAGEKQAYAERFVQLVRVEGPVLWRHSSGPPRVIRHREGRHHERIEVGISPAERWAVHETGGGRFRFVRQQPRHLSGRDERTWDHDARSRGRAGDDFAPRPSVVSDDDFARWLSTISEPLTLDELLAHVDGLVPTGTPQDRAVAPYTLRKALLERGYPVPGVIHLTTL